VLVVAGVAVVVFTASGGKAYYPAPVVAALFAAGAARVEATQWLHDPARGWGNVARPLVASAVIAALIGLPVLPVGAADAMRAVNPTALETYGWPGFVDQVRQAAEALPPGTPIFTSNYGEAGALTILGPAQGLRQPVFSAQNSYALWGPPPGRPDVALCVGEFGPEQLHRAWAEVTEVAPIRMNGVHDQETEQNAAIYVCRRPLGTWAQLWPALVHFD
jgi:hypothetical protein